MATDALLEVRSVTRRLRLDARSCSGIDLAIQPGEIVAIIGRNGVGKSTMMRSLIGQLPVWRGLDQAQRRGDRRPAARAAGAEAASATSRRAARSSRA